MIILEALINHPKVAKLICVPEGDGTISITIFTQHTVRNIFRTHQVKATKQLLFLEQPKDAIDNEMIAEMFFSTKDSG